ncbi:MAG: FYDLN acid domain-containing protein [Tagaea sp.]|nr:FYDLN acid domain-containing protein [Tagaea sp.]
MTHPNPARGTKRACQSCAARYYDLGKPEPVCPKCGAAYVEPPRALPTHRVRRSKPALLVPAVAVEADAPVMDGKEADEVLEKDDEEVEEPAEDEVEAEAAEKAE